MEFFGAAAHLRLVYILMNPHEEILSFLEDRSDIQIDESSDSITVLSPDFSGFDVHFREWETVYEISFGEWHEYLPKTKKGAKIALGLFKFGLSDSCRLKIYRKGNVDFKCELEYKDQDLGHWNSVATQSAIFYPFWEKEQIYCLHNSFITVDFFLELFKGEDFEKVITEIKYTRKHAKYAIAYSSIWLAIFLTLNKFDYSNIFVSFILFSPAIFVTLLLPLLAMRNWFDDRKYGKPKRVILSKNKKNFLFFWISIWFLGFLIVYALWGIENLITIFIMLFPFLLIAFCIPVFIVTQKK